MDRTDRAPGIVGLTRRLEDAAALDGPVRALEGPIRTAFATGRRGSVLRGEWLGHALHPLLTDLVIGSWTSASVLDLVGGPESAVGARKLVGVGLLAFGPTAWSGWAEWSETGPREKRVGVVHAVTVGTAVALYTGSWVARRRGRHGAGAGLSAAGASVAGLGAYLGGHLAIARKVGTHHPAYDGAPVASVRP